jgi:uncharacterized protein (DUF885 family)
MKTSSFPSLQLISCLSITLLLFPFTACVPAPEDTEGLARSPAHAAERTSAETSSATAALRALADDVWASTLENSTYLRLQEGLPIERFEDLTLEDYRAEQVRTVAFRDRLAGIDESRLDGDDLITYEILAVELEDLGATDDDYWLRFDITPYVSPYLVRFAQQALHAQRIIDRTSADQYAALVGELADVIDQLNAKVAGQVERGIYLPKPALRSVRATWQGIAGSLPAAIRVDDSRLTALAEGERDAFRAVVESLIETRVVAGLERLLASIDEDYEAQAPDSVGLSQYPNGGAVYRRLIRQTTTLNLTPEQIHERGKAAVAEISARMQAIRDERGFTGTPREFIEEIKRDPRFIAESPEELEQGYLEYIHRIEPMLDDWFMHQPAAAYGVRRLPPAAEAGMTYGYYNTPTADDPVGYYNYNASNLPERSLAWAGPLIYHELLPGHHFHMATQNENRNLQSFRRKYLVGAFNEGWAEYAASLGLEMGAYETPLERYGRYLTEMFLATRLVVDTGMNALGWSLEDARDYMRQRVIQSDAEIDSETLRYSTSIPAQALGYRLGYEKIWELRRRAEAALGGSFDIREFHDVVLSDGAKPLPVLEAKVDHWIASH